MGKSGEPGFVRVTIKVPSGTDGAARLARLFRQVREGAVLGEMKLSEWITQAILERRDRLVAEGKWEGERGKGSPAEWVAGGDGGADRGGAGEGGGT